MPRVFVRPRHLGAVCTLAAFLMSACTTGTTTPPPTPAVTSAAPSPTTQANTPTTTPGPAGSPATVVVRATLEGDLPGGWDVASEGTLLSFATAGDHPTVTIELLANRAVMAADCALGAEPSAGNTADAIVDALAARRGLAVTGDQAADVGGFSGRSIEITLDAAVGVTCPSEDGGFVPLFGSMESYGWGFAGVATDERLRLVALDVPGGGNLVILVTAPDAGTYDALLDAVNSIIEHLAFEVVT